jgi:hypothetical protein
MTKYSINQNLAGAFIAGAVGLTLIGGGGYVGYSALTASDSAETAERRRQSSRMRMEIATYLPLTREMIIAAPPAEYPESSKGDLKRTFSSAEEIIGNTRMGDLKLRCELLTYLRAVHRRATEYYLASQPSLPLPNLQTHIEAAQRNVPVAPLCQPR